MDKDGLERLIEQHGGPPVRLESGWFLFPDGARLSPNFSQGFVSLQTSDPLYWRKEYRKQRLEWAKELKQRYEAIFSGSGYHISQLKWPEEHFGPEPPAVGPGPLTDEVIHARIAVLDKVVGKFEGELVEIEEVMGV